MEKENKYEYTLLTVFDEDNCGWDYRGTCITTCERTLKA